MKAKEAIVVSHTHWDREWYMPFQEYRIWLLNLVDDLLKVFDEKPGFKCFTFDGQTSALEDYLEIRPENLEKFKKLVTEKKILIGPWYTQPDEWLVSPEALIRNLLIGHRIGQKFGHILKVGYVPDNFGHPCQLPQIFRGFGIDSFIFQRGMGDEGESLGTEFIWQAPNGSQAIGVHLITGYCNAAFLGIPLASWRTFIHFWEGPEGNRTYPRSFGTVLNKVDAKEAVRRVKQLSENLSHKSASDTLLFMNGCDHLPAQPGIVDAIELVNSKSKDFKLIHGGLPDYLNRIRPLTKNFRHYKGEFWGARYHHLLPGVLSTRMYLKQQNRKAETLLECYAEPLACYASLFGYKYPRELLTLAWKMLLLNHAHDSIHGSSVDSVHAEMESRNHQIIQIANSIIHNALDHIAEQTQSLPSDSPIKVLVYNPSSWPRTDVAKVWVNLPSDNYIATDLDGKATSIQFLKESVEFPRKDLTHISFIARGLPSMGYRQYALEKAKTPNLENGQSLKAQNNVLENEFLLVEAVPNQGGAITIKDKRNLAVYNDLSYFCDEGDDGDVWNYSPPRVKDNIVTSLKKQSQIEIVENGPVTATLKISFALKVPKEIRNGRRSNKSVELPMTSYVSLHSGIPRVDVKTIIDNMAKDHRLRVVFPTGLHTSSVNVDGTFYVNKRPLTPITRGEDWFESPPTTHAQKSWIDVNEQKRGITIANKGLPEYECKEENGVTVYMTLLRCTGKLGGKDLIVRKKYIGLPEIPVPEAQCQGVYAFEYSIIPHVGSWAEAKSYQLAGNFVNPLACWSSEGGKNELPAEDSFVKIQPDNLVVTAIKKAEDDESIIIRFYEIQGKPVIANISVHRKCEQAWLINLNEEKLQKLEVKNGQIKFPVEAHEIATINLEMVQGKRSHNRKKQQEKHS